MMMMMPEGNDTDTYSLILGFNVLKVDILYWVTVGYVIRRYT